MNFKKLEESVLGISSRSVISAGIGTLSTIYFIPESGGSINVMGYNVPTWAIYAGIFGASSGLNETVKDIFKPITPDYLKASYALQPIASGVATVGVTYAVGMLLGAPFEISMVRTLYPFLIGAGADLAASYVVDNVVKPISKIEKVNNIANSLNPNNFLPDLGIDMGMPWF